MLRAKLRALIEEGGEALAGPHAGNTRGLGLTGQGTARAQT